jgi:hypothetical protein
MRRSRLGISGATAALALACAAGCQVEGGGLAQPARSLPGTPPSTSTPGPSVEPAPKGGSMAPDAGATNPGTSPPPAMGMGMGSADAAPVAGMDASAPEASTPPPMGMPPVGLPPADAAVPPDVAPTQPPPGTNCARLPTGPFARPLRPEAPGGDEFTFDNQGHMLSFSGDNVVRLQGNNVDVVARNIIGRQGGAMRVLADGDIVVADSSSDRLMRIDPRTGTERLPVSVRSPVKMAVGPGQRLFVTSTQGDIYRVDPNQQRAVVVAETRSRLGGLTFSPDYRTLYVSSSQQRAVYAYSVDAQGNLGRPLLWSSRIEDAVSLATDECGNVYAAGSDNGRLVRVDASGNLTVIADSLGTNIWAIAFGSGQHSWRDDAIYVLDFQRSQLHEVRVGVKAAPPPK